MNGAIKKDLRIFRGTYKECMAQATEDMKIYLAWDTHEIFVGNRAGGKIKYGGSSSNDKIDIESYFQEFRKEIYEKVEEFASLKVNDLVTPKVEEIIKLIDEFDKRTEERLETLVDEVYAEVERQFAGLTSQFDTLADTVEGLSSELSTSNENISKNLSDINLLKGQIENLKGKDTELVSKLQTLEARLNTVSSNVETNTSNIAALASNLSTLESDITGLTGSISRIDTNIDEIEANIDNVEKSIEVVSGKIDSKLSKKDADDLYLNKDALDNINISGAYVAYKTGDDIAKEIGELSDISEFAPTFCILDSTVNEDYNAGTFYFYSNGEIIEVATGGETKVEEIISTISMVSTATDFTDATNIEEVNDTPLSVEFKVSINNMDAVDGNLVTIKYGTSTEKVDISAKDAVFIKTVSVPRESVGSYKISASATAKAATKRYKYTVNGASKTYSIYKPCFIGTDESNLTKLGRNYTGTWGPDKTSKDTSGNVLYIYTTGTISKITMNGFGYSFSLVDDSYTLNVNGVDCTYYKYSLGNIYSKLDNIIIS